MAADFTVNGNRLDLVNGLHNVIEKVKQLPSDHEFNMWKYKKCVIGFYFSDDETVDVYNDEQTLKLLFNIDVFTDLDKPFCLSEDNFLFNNPHKPYNKDQLQVLRLFSDEEHLISAKEWLEKANKVYKNLMG